MTAREVLVTPSRPNGVGVLVLAGSSGRLDVERARLLSQGGATALAMRWFGAPGLQPGPYAVPLELFVGGLDRLAATCERLAVVGTSFGAEAAFMLASVDTRVEFVAGFAPSAYVWAGVTPDGQQVSHWTWRGAPVPFVRLAVDWVPDGDPPAYVGLYLRSLAVSDSRSAAAIDVGRIRGDVLLVAGGDDLVWPSVRFAEAVAEERRRLQQPVTVVTHPLAGHRTVLPGEQPVAGGQRMARGGSPGADAELGELAWPHLVRGLRLRPPPG